MPGNRNSCFKIDPDVTFMHIKYDYYKHTNVFKPEYNIQFGISDGIVSVPSRTALRRIGYALFLDLTMYHYPTNQNHILLSISLFAIQPITLVSSVSKSLETSEAPLIA